MTPQAARAVEVKTQRHFIDDLKAMGPGDAADLELARS